MLKINESSFIAKQIIFFDEIDSTNEYLINNPDNITLFDGTLVYSGYQFSGKGYINNKWISEKEKNILCSILLKPQFLEVNDQFLLSKIISLAIVEVLNELADLEFMIKWPNDIYYKNSKIAGTLIQNSIQANKIIQSVVGIGININQTNFDSSLPNPISLKNITNKDRNCELLISQICIAIEKWYLILENGNYDLINKVYLEKLFAYQENRKFILHNGEIIEGSIYNISETGELQLLTNDGLKSFRFKEIQILFA